RGRPLPIEGSGRQRRDLSYIDNVVAKLTLLSRGELPDVLNIGSGTSTSVLTVAEIVGRLTGNTATIQMPARPNEIQGVMAETTLQRQIVGEVEPSVSLEEGIERTVRWWARSQSAAGLGFPV